MTARIKEGVNYVRRATWMWTTVSFAGVGNALIFVPSHALLPYFLLHRLHSARWVVGLSYTIAGVASTVATLVVGSRQPPRRRVRTMWSVWLFSLASALIVVVATNVGEALVVPLVMSPTILYGNVIRESVLQSETPRPLLGRISSVDWFVSLGLAPLGLIVAGVMVSVVGIRTYFLFAVLFCGGPGVLGLFSSRINEVDAGRDVPQSPAPTP